MLQIYFEQLQEPFLWSQQGTSPTIGAGSIPLRE